MHEKRLDIALDHRGVGYLIQTARKWPSKTKVIFATVQSLARKYWENPLKYKKYMSEF